MIKILNDLKPIAETAHDRLLNNLKDIELKYYHNTSNYSQKLLEIIKDPQFREYGQKGLEMHEFLRKLPDK